MNAIRSKFGNDLKEWIEASVSLRHCSIPERRNRRLDDNI